MLGTDIMVLGRYLIVGYLDPSGRDFEPMQGSLPRRMGTVRGLVKTAMAY